MLQKAKDQVYEDEKKNNDDLCIETPSVAIWQHQNIDDYNYFQYNQNIFKLSRNCF
jgi:hypothetical protein